MKGSIGVDIIASMCSASVLFFILPVAKNVTRLLIMGWNVLRHFLNQWQVKNI